MGKERKGEGEKGEEKKTHTCVVLVCLGKRTVDRQHLVVGPKAVGLSLIIQNKTSLFLH